MGWMLRKKGGVEGLNGLFEAVVGVVCLRLLGFGREGRRCVAWCVGWFGETIRSLLPHRPDQRRRPEPPRQRSISSWRLALYASS